MPGSPERALGWRRLAGLAGARPDERGIARKCRELAGEMSTRSDKEGPAASACSAPAFADMGVGLFMDSRMSGGTARSSAR